MAKIKTVVEQEVPYEYLIKYSDEYHRFGLFIAGDPKPLKLGTLSDCERYLSDHLYGSDTNYIAYYDANGTKVDENGI